ncbi:LysR family transcriptional regulator [Bacillus sp. V5-8f]|uniref:LysR family transcriptional regulator n=1 Tax=Bacillus sp. V5-8f TaxID=2053044 RepID=UPI000C76E2A1|nr:LysR family transcriptional regulator [Bacillus sp. V5-8f]PLT33502.1 LysR family transcriptional regulator [Bacillus sp. V5-8f]
MDIKWIKTFIFAAENENFRKTSEQLYLTQPAVTKHIQRLEEHLNVQLFERVGKKVALTPAGHKFLSFARDLISKYEQGVTEFDSWKEGYSRKLIIAAAPQIASSFLPDLLRNFIDEHPTIEVLISVLKSYDICEAISAGRADVGLTRILPIQANINSEIVHEESVILVGPPQCKEDSSFDEQTVLHKYRLISHNHPDYWDKLLKDVKRHYPTVKTMKVDQVEVTKRFIEVGLGVSYLPYAMVKDEIGAKKLVEIQPDKIEPPTSSTYVLTKVETDEVSIFTTFLKEALSYQIKKR